MCEGTSRQYAEKSSIWFQSFINSGAIDTIVKKKYSPKNSPLNVSPKFTELTSSAGFYNAMNECFGNDDKMKTLFFTSLLALDISGKFSAWVVDISLLRPLYWGVRGAAASAELTTMQAGKRYFWFRIFFSYASRQMAFKGVSVYKLLTPILLSATAGEAFSYYHEMKDRLNVLSGKTPEKIAELKNEIQYFKLLISQSKDQQEIADLELFIEQDLKTINRIKS